MRCFVIDLVRCLARCSVSPKLASSSSVASVVAVADLLGDIVALLRAVDLIVEELEVLVTGAYVGPVWYVGEAVDDDSLSLSDLSRSRFSSSPPTSFELSGIVL